MPRLALLLLILGVLPPHTLTGGLLRPVADLLSSDSGQEMDTNGSPAPSEPTSDRGWEMDPNG